MVSALEQSIIESLRKAAVLGRFNALDLVSQSSDEGVFSSRLALICEELVEDEAYGWTVRNQERALLLHSLNRNDIRKLLAATNAMVSPNDVFASSLRKVLSGELPDATIDRQVALASLQVGLGVKALAQLHGSMAEAATRLEGETLAAHESSSLNFVLSSQVQLVGRDDELAKLTQFATAAVPGPAIVLSGDAGVGKSALLAAVVRNLRSMADPPLTILIDFDRPQLTTAEPSEIMRDFSRKLTAAAISAKLLDPEEVRILSTVMKNFRKQIRSRVVGNGDRIQSLNSEEQYRVVTSYAFDEFQKVSPKLRAERIVLILDTFEIALAAGPHEVRRILELVDALRTRFGFQGLRAIFAGRGLHGRLSDPVYEAEFALAPKKEWISLSALKPDAAQQMLANLDKETHRFPLETMLERAAEVTQGYPLSLKLIYSSTEGMSQPRVEALLNDLNGSQDFMNELNTQFIQKRILGRIDEPDLKKIAMPGLLLRIISPELIRLVLSGPCKLGKVSQSRAETMYKQLQNTWLIDRPGELFSRHRDDLRRQLVGGIIADHAAQAQALNLAAADFYTTAPKDDEAALKFWNALSPSLRRTEEIYHRALASADSPTVLEPSEARTIKRELGLDLELLPSPWIATIRASSEDFAALTEKQIGELSGGLRERAIEETVNRLLKSDDSEGAARVARLRDPVPEMVDPVPSVVSEAPGTAAAAEGPNLPAMRQGIIIAWSNGEIAEAAEAFRQIVEFGPDKDVCLVAELHDAVVSDGRSTSVGVLAASVHLTWDDADLGSDVPAALAAPYLAARLMLADDQAFSSIRDGLQSSLLVTQALHEPLRAYDLRRLAAWRAMLQTRFGKQPGIDRVEISKDYLSIETLRAACDDDESTKATFLVVDKRTASQISRLKPGQTRRSLIEDIYKSEDQITCLLPVPSQMKERALEMFRGLTPELHTPAAFLLRRIPYEEVLDWVKVVAHRNPLWPQDQQYDGSSRSGRTFPEREALAVVVTSDRLGLLLELLEWMSSRIELAQDLVRIHRRISQRMFFLKADSHRGGVSHGI
ncbi:AAA family ATPase [Rhizobium johnstonii]|uniref:ATP-binding protein n=1 Tax=Rhizobium johnstonii TaxID=3019933 RepID=UPI003F9B4067